MIEYVSGDMFVYGRYDVMVNAVNCVGVMGKGVAKEFKERWPAMFQEYREKCSRGEVKPGVLHVWNGNGITIVNLPTKTHWRDSSTYNNIEAGLDALRAFLDGLDGAASVAMPAIGCGFGGLDWGTVARMIEKNLGESKASVTVFLPRSI